MGVGNRILEGIIVSLSEYYALALSRRAKEIVGRHVARQRREETARTPYGAVGIGDPHASEFRILRGKLCHIVVQFPRSSDFIPTHRLDALVDQRNYERVGLKDFERVLTHAIRAAVNVVLRFPKDDEAILPPDDAEKRQRHDHRCRNENDLSARPKPRSEGFPP